MEYLAALPYIPQVIFIFALGLAAGSFSNVCIHRIPRKESVVFPVSHCTACDTPIRAFDNIPVLSFLLLSGKCRACGKAISKVYPLIELITAVTLLAGFVRFGISWELLIFFIVGPTLIVITVIDLRHQIIPDIITLPGIAFGLLAGSYMVGWQNSLLGLALGGGSFYLIAMVYFWIRGTMGMGGGDIKYIAAAGALLGWQKILLVIFFGAFLGSLVGLSGILMSKMNALSKIPFGPFLTAGTLVALLSGDELIRLYLLAMGLTR